MLAHRILPAILGALALIACHVLPAHAQASRTWVSGVGDDANPCSRTAPCQTFAGAISKTAAPGEINCLDPGDFGAVTITKAMTILCDPVSNGGVISVGAASITVTAGTTDKVVLEGLNLAGVEAGTNGVQVNSGAAVYILRCTIRDFNGNGVNVTSTTAGTRVFIEDSFIENNAGGVNVQGSGVGNSASIANTLIDGNVNFAVQAAGTGNAIGLVQAILSGSPAGVILSSGATATSFGPSNVIAGTGAVTSTAAYK
jgi:hypothetical protein